MKWIELFLDEGKKIKDPRVRVNMVYTVMPHDTVLSPSVFFRMCNIRKKETYMCF